MAGAREHCRTGRGLVYGITVACMLAGAAWAGWQPEFNWVAAGGIDVGDPRSEQAAVYQCGDPVSTVRLRFKDSLATDVVSRIVQERERFNVPVPMWNGMHMQAYIVIAKTLDSDDSPVELSVQLANEGIGTWLTVPPSGPRQMYEAYFVIPPSLWGPFATGKSNITVTITTPQPIRSIGYHFHHTRDWDVLGGKYTRDILANYDEAPPAVQQYLEGLQYEAQHEWRRAWRRYQGAARIGTTNIARLARASARRCMMRLDRASARIVPAFDTAERHYRIGLLAGTEGYWPDAWAEFTRAVELDPGSADAAYRAAEAADYIYNPAPGTRADFARAAALVCPAQALTQQVLIVLGTNAVFVPGVTASIDVVQATSRWDAAAAMVRSTTRGALVFDTEVIACNADGTQWTYSLDDGPTPPAGTVPDKAYDYCICLTGVTQTWVRPPAVELAGAACACLPVGARPEELFGAWYRMFEFVGGRGGDLPVFPVGEAARLCGRQPAPRAACAWRSILRRTLAPADLRRMAINAQLGDASCLALWALGPVVSVPDPPEVVNGVMEEWLTAEHHLSDVDIQDLRQEWKRRQRRHSIAITLTNAPAADAGMYWHVFLQQAWLNAPLMDTLTHGEEQPFVRGYGIASAMHALAATGDYVDLTAALPSTPQKSVAYVRTFLRVDRRTNVRFWFACRDRAVFWLNGTRLHSPAISDPTRWFDAPSPGAYAVNTVLLPGVNVLAAKIERGGGDWGFSVHAVDADNRPLQHLTVTRTGLPAVSVPAYTNENFTWAQVADDWYRVLPQLDQAALRRITDMPGLRFDPAHFHLGLPDGVTPLPGSRYRAEPGPADRTFDNSLNWDYERAAALRFVRQRRTRDLLLVRPEYLEEFLALLKTTASSRLPSESLRGYIMVPHCTCESTPDHGPRAVLVLETQLGTYPEDDAALLSSAGAAAYLTTGRTATDAPPATDDE